MNCPICGEHLWRFYNDIEETVKCPNPKCGWKWRMYLIKDEDKDRLKRRIESNPIVKDD
jgi:hypothetical protein